MRKTTRDAIMESFVKLLNEKPFDKITVKDIVEDCGVNRNTFYYYYQDIYALLEDMFAAATKDALSYHGDFSSWEEGFIESTKFALSNKKAIYHIYKSVKREQLDNYLYKVAEKVMIDAIKKQTEDLNVQEKDIGLMAAFYKYALVGMVIEWLDNGMKEPPEQNIHRLGELLSGNIRYTFTKHEQ